MDLHEALRTRRTIHRYDTGDVSEAVIERALTAANMAPNHRHTWPWRFTVLGRTARAPLAEIAVALKTRPDAPMKPETETAIRAKILDPCWCIVVRRVRHEDEMTAREDYAAIACAIQNMQLSLHADGVGAKWTTGKVTRDARTYDELDIDKATEEIVGFVWAGVPRDEHKAPQRLDIATLVTWLR